MTRWRFDGEITGLGTGSGVRIVVGHWSRSPLGEFTDVMVELADGHRVLLAPSEVVRDFVTATYVFDETVIVSVRCSRSGGSRTVEGGDLRVSFELGARTTLGRLLNLIPRALASAPWFCVVSDPIARVVLRGVRTRGTAGNGRREYYGAVDQWRVVGMSASWRGRDLGALQPVDPPVRFGFGSTPRTPAATSIVTTIVD
ncbi:hypothetical protein OPAG_01213 [Rhodococcus opacus PD630]|uniref:hypothetical protein n=1 Tax=Rhodococcus opacus TaxID=37919 RepID=UPI00029CCAB3|nr:hypothetical protein [Rhodococcus opacus]AHK34038.1 hypothetical protein Pd630_LPD06853 [Rhodococcus opacus PD630]EHI40041.1 hypothetical protein OPAG_01213 [Rhodococcus opacus PD630]UDG96247.1 hypothetical protein K2Z90_006453 [Rhodococcus opacus PD630]